jgi:hypothetical protein
MTAAMKVGKKCLRRRNGFRPDISEVRKSLGGFKRNTPQRPKMRMILS